MESSGFTAIISFSNPARLTSFPSLTYVLIISTVTLLAESKIGFHLQY